MWKNGMQQRKEIISQKIREEKMSFLNFHNYTSFEYLSTNKTFKNQFGLS